MKLLHCDYGELTIIDISARREGTIIKVIDSYGEKSHKTWEVLWMNDKVRIIADD